MDFISGFPRVHDMSSTLVVVDRLTKEAIFIPTPTTSTTEKTVELFSRHAAKFFGDPEDIESDRDSRFKGKFWMALFGFLG